MHLIAGSWTLALWLMAHFVNAISSACAVPAMTGQSSSCKKSPLALALQNQLYFLLCFSLKCCCFVLLNCVVRICKKS